MKKMFKGMALALILALAVGAMALAETVTPDASEPATSADATTESSALEDAFEAYQSARESSYTEDLEAELKEYVAAGKLTQEQADLILNYYKEQQSLRNGVCPNCGYEFQTNGGYGRGGKGHGRGGKGGMGRMGGMRGMGGMYGMYGAPQRYAVEEPEAAADEAALELSVMENPFRSDYL